MGSGSGRGSRSCPLRRRSTAARQAPVSIPRDSMNSLNRDQIGGHLLLVNVGGGTGPLPAGPRAPIPVPR